MTIEQIDIELAELSAKVKPLLQRSEALNRERRRLLSVAFINANGVTRDEVQLSTGHAVPYCGMINTFANWLRDTKCPKRFCEWNGTIYFTAEIVAGRMDPNAPANISDLPKATI